MPEYVEREVLDDFKNEIVGRFIVLCFGNDYNKLSLLTIGNNIDEIYEKYRTRPAADVAEVRHGEWNENIIGFCNVCMECGAIVERTAIKNKSGELNYCPNCGDRMDGKGERRD